jgi:GMP synthase (glutamine-hydrolysing)
MSTTIADALASTTPVLPDATAVPTTTKRRIDAIRVVIVDNLLRTEDDISDIARELPGFDERAWLKTDRYISSLAIPNIEQNVHNLAERPEVKILHLSEANAENIDAYRPDAVVLSGTLRDFDFYHPRIIRAFSDWVLETRTPVLGICGGHQLVGQAFGAEIVTLDRKQPAERRAGRLNEYQYRYVKILDDDPIFDRIDDRNEDSNPYVRGRRRILRVWQNHGLMIDRVPEGFVNLASGYMCPIQMMVKRTQAQLIYTVQFHIEKSFEDYGRPRKFWDHHVESRDGRIIFENFLVEALKHRDGLRGDETAVA